MFSARDKTKLYGYDLDGNLTEQTDRNGRVTTYGYDHLGNATQELWFASAGATTAGHSIVSGYDLGGRKTRAEDLDGGTGAGSTAVYAYDGAGRVTLEETWQSGVMVGTAGIELDRTYDLAGQQTLTVLKIGVYAGAGGASGVGGGAYDVFTQYQYDGTGRTTDIHQFSYSAGISQGLITSADFPVYGVGTPGAPTAAYAVVGKEAVYGYDAVGKITQVSRSGIAGCVRIDGADLREKSFVTAFKQQKILTGSCSSV